MKRMLLFLAAFGLLMAGCAPVVSDYELPTYSAESTVPTDTTPVTAREWREYNTYPVGLDVDTLLGHTDHEIVFLQGKYAQYYDLEMRRTFAFCSQPNCVHNDESCPSYFGGDSVMDTDYVVSGDSIYAVCVEGDIHLRLRQLHPLTGEKTDLWTLDLPEYSQGTDADGTPMYVGYSFHGIDLTLAGTTLLLQYTTERYTTRFEADRQVSDSAETLHCLRYDLRTGTAETILEEEYLQFEHSYVAPGGILDASDRYALCSTGQVFSEPPMSKEEYLAAGGNEDDYYSYRGLLMHNAYQAQEIILWDLETGEKTPLCTMNDLRMDSTRALDPYRHRVCFLKNEHEIWRVDLMDGSQTRLLDFDGNIATLEQWDGRVFFAAWREQEDGSGVYDNYWYEPATGELRAWATGVQVCPFSICGETDRYLLGLVADGSTRALDKQDFYNGNFDAALKIGWLSMVD